MQSCEVSMLANPDFCNKQRDGMIVHFFHGDGLNISRIPANRKSRRFSDRDIQNTLQYGDPLTSYDNRKSPAFRPLVEMTFIERVNGEESVNKFYYGVVVAYRELDEGELDEGEPECRMSSKLDVLASREYLIVWSDSTVDFRSRDDLDVLLKRRPDTCFQCGSLNTELKSHLVTCESCFMCWHEECIDNQAPKVGGPDDDWFCLDCSVHLKNLTTLDNLSLGKGTQM
jgi:hypothetical protein